MTFRSPEADKANIRQQLKQRRQNLAPAQRQVASARLCRSILSSIRLQQGQRLGFYWPAAGEADLRPLAREVHRRGIHCFLPVIQIDKSLRFARWHPGSTLQRNRYGIPEPKYAPGQTLDINDLAVLLMPVVAMDQQGGRLGMGGGYYDRSLAKAAGQGQTTLRLGVGYQFQYLRQLPREPWDQSLDGMLCPGFSRLLAQRNRR